MPPAEFGREEPVPPPRVGEDARSYAARTRGALITANDRLVNDSAFYADVRKNFSR